MSNEERPHTKSVQLNSADERRANQHKIPTSQLLLSCS